MARALTALRERPALQQVALTELANARHAAVVRSFIDALTRVKAPMEMYAHDPLRYCGDMLAWTHQAVASEKELFAGLFLSRSVRLLGFFFLFRYLDQQPWAQPCSRRVRVRCRRCPRPPSALR
jgi:hypothetical protein